MRVRFEVQFPEQAIDFLEKLDDKTRNKIYYNLKKAQLIHNDELFKKLNRNI